MEIAIGIILGFITCLLLCGNKGESVRMCGVRRLPPASYDPPSRPVKQSPYPAHLCVRCESIYRSEQKNSKCPKCGWKLMRIPPPPHKAGD